MARFLKRLCLVLAGTLLIGQAQAGAVQGKPCTYEDLMPEYEKFSLRTDGLAPAERARAASLMLRDVDRTGPDADRWFLLGTCVEGLPPRAGYYLGYLFARRVGEGKALPLLPRMAPGQVRRQEIEFLTQLAHGHDVAP